MIWNGPEELESLKSCQALSWKYARSLCNKSLHKYFKLHFQGHRAILVIADRFVFRMWRARFNVPQPAQSTCGLRTSSLRPNKYRINRTPLGTSSDFLQHGPTFTTAQFRCRGLKPEQDESHDKEEQIVYDWESWSDSPDVPQINDADSTESDDSDTSWLADLTALASGLQSDMSQEQEALYAEARAAYIDGFIPKERAYLICLAILSLSG